MARMSLRRILQIGLLLAGLWMAIEVWRTHRSAQRLAPGADQAHKAWTSEPMQESTHAPPFTLAGYQIQPVAEFSLRARVLGREDYRFGREADLSPMDLALGWNRMADPAVYEALNIRQGGRWYRYSWSDQAPIPAAEIIASSANMHLIPAHSGVRKVLDRAGKGHFIRMQGKLVQVSHPSGWQWNSSLTRTDTGHGSCELLYVESASLE